MYVADLLVRPAELHLAGKAWPVLFDHRVLLGIEQATGLRVLAGELDLTRPRLRHLRAALFGILQRAGAGVSLDEAGALISPHTVVAVQAALVEGWALSMSEPEEGAPPAASGAPSKIHSWLEAWAIARYDLRLTDGEWLAITPRQLEALRTRQMESMRREEILTGIIASTAANFSTCRPKQGLKAEDFMLHPFPPAPPPVIDAEYLLRAFAHIPKTKESYGIH